jgi:apolipoprotein N-acyltransferase
MQDVSEQQPEELGTVRQDRIDLARSWVPLLAAAILLPFANGGHTIALAAWLAPLFLLRFTRTHRIIVIAPVTLVLQVAALAIQFRGMVPLPMVIYAFVFLIYGACFTIPYLADRLLRRRLPGFWSTLVFPFLWVGIEFLMSRGPFGSWFSAAYSQYGSLALLQILSVTGLWGVTFLIGWTAVAGNSLWEEWAASRRVPRVAVACAVVVAAVVFAGGTRLALFPPSAETVRVASLSPLDLKTHVDPELAGRFLHHEALTATEIATIRERFSVVAEDLLRRSDREARAGARIIFWGEGNARVLKEDEDDLVRQGGTLAKSNGLYLGMSLWSWHLEATPPIENKIVLLQPDGRPAWEYFKAHPVPGGEAAMSITRDGKLHALDTPYGRLSSVICYDADFPRLLAQAGDLRADIVLDPSNDWKAIDPWHTRMASFRAIEQGFNLVRQASLGLSAAFDYEGRQLSSMDHYVAEDRTLITQVPTRGVRTAYALFGDWFGWVCLVGFFGLVLLAMRRTAPK